MDLSYGIAGVLIGGILNGSFVGFLSSFFRPLRARRSSRVYDDRQPITIAQLARLLDGAARIIAHRKLGGGDGEPPLDVAARPYPSGGASYELELYLAVHKCDGLPRGFYHYDADRHALVAIGATDRQLDALLQDGQYAMGAPAPPLEQAFEIERSHPHGHVAAVLGTLKRVELDRLLGKDSALRKRVIAMLVERVLRPCSKLATARALNAATRTSTLGPLLELDALDEDDLYEAMDWLLARQGEVEAALAKRHLAEGSLVLYDVSSTYFEGRCCPLAKLGHSRDGKPERPQIVFGLLTNIDGCPVAVEVFEGNTGDPKTLGSQITKVRERFGLQRIVLVGDRGMITQARIDRELASVEGLEWISALRAPSIAGLVEAGALQLSLFDRRDLAEISSPEFPGERLIVCKNPLLAEERARKRLDLLAATEAALARIGATTLDTAWIAFRRARSSVAPGPRRRSRIVLIRPSEPERRMHRLLEEYTRRVWREASARGDPDARLASIILRKRALSMSARISCRCWTRSCRPATRRARCGRDRPAR